MKKIKQLLVVILFVIGIGSFLVPSYAGAVTPIDPKFCADPLNSDSLVCKGQDDNVGTIVGQIVNTLLFLLGIAAVIVIIIGGITYTTSGGNDANVKRAKDMILYAVIGLVVAFAAYAIVNWVLKAFG